MVVRLLHFICYFRKLKGAFTLDKLIMDAGYKTPAIAQYFSKKLTPVFPYKRPMTKAGYFKRMTMPTIDIMRLLYLS